MNRIHLKAWVGIVLGLSTVSIQDAAVAQLSNTTRSNAAIAAPPKPLDQSLEWSMVRLQDVQARIVAWWLDPAHNLEPQEFKHSREALESSGHAAEVGESLNSKQASAFGLPKGVSTVVPVDAQNALLVLGTADGTQELKRLVATLDKSIPQVEIALRAVEINPADAMSLRIEPFHSVESVAGDPNKTTQRSIGFVRGDVETQIEELVRLKKAKILSTPRKTTMDRVPTTLFLSPLSRAGFIGVENDAGQLKPLAESPQDAAASPVFVTTEWPLTVAPTVKEDKTMTLNFKLSKQVTLNGVDGSAPDYDKRFLLGTSDAMTTTVTVKDNDTIAFTGLPASMFNGSLVQDKASTSRLILLMTVRLISR